MYSSQRQRKNNYEDMVTSYYEVVTELFHKKWGTHFHEAFFKNSSESKQSAMKKTNRLFLRDSKLRPNDNAIDLGCGIGTFACYVASEIGCNVTGINLSKFQLQKAKKIVRQKKLHNVKFQYLDIMNLGKLHNKFDAAFSIAVNCHLPDKVKALKNIYKILKQGGRLVISDYLQKHTLNPFEKELLIEPFNHYWCYPYMESVEGYKKILKEVGFTIIKARDVSKQVKKNFDIYYDVALNEIKTMNYKKMLSYINNPAMLKNYRKYREIAKNQCYANLFGKICLEAGVFRYGYFVAEK